MGLWLLLSCAIGIRGAYEAERTSVLRTPPPLAEAWSPDVRVRMTTATMSRIARSAVAQDALSWRDQIAIKPPIGPKIRVVPQVKINDLQLRTSASCKACLVLHAQISGKAKLKAGSLAGDIPFKASLSATTQVLVLEEGDQWQVAAKVKKIRKLEVTTVGGLGGAASGPLERWLTQALKSRGPIPLTTVGGDSLPVRGLRVNTTQGVLEVEVRTAFADTKDIGPATEPPGQWDIRMHPDTLVALLRVRSFTEGPGKFQIVDDPRALRMDGQVFELDLRLWRLAGLGWWRDYTVHGTVRVKGKRLVMNPTEAIPGEKSRGAGVADPLFLLAERKTLKGVTEGVRLAIPARKSTQVGKVKLRPRITGVTGTDEAIQVTGTMD